MEGAELLIGKKKHNYTSLGDDVSVDSALVQASVLLDLAAHRALDRGNPKEISDVAESWLGLASVATNISLTLNAANAATEQQQKQREKEEFKTGFSGPDTQDEKVVE